MCYSDTACDTVSAHSLDFNHMSGRMVLNNIARVAFVVRPSPRGNLRSSNVVNDRLIV